MTQAVIAALGRSAIGRARKGSLVDVRPDDLASYVVNKVLEKVPQLERSEIEDLICGCGLPGGEQGHNIGRVVSILSRLDVPGVTVNRYCSSSLMTTRMAAHAIEAGEGDVFLSVGVECVSRYGSGYPDALCAASIPDIVRMLTISDIFSALIEQRSYKATMPREQAYERMRSMQGRLEGPLVAAFRDVALNR